MRRYSLPTVFDLKMSVSVSGIVSLLILWLVLAIIGIVLIRLPILESVIGGLIAAVLHYVSDLFHQFGHSIAARRTGYPMSGIFFWGIFGASLYPKDEGELPGSVHIQRALGGPIMSFIVTFILGILLLAMGNSGSVVWWIMLFLFLDNLLVFALGALMPIRMGDFVTDGATILYWRARS
jgi:Zn-dependent protease